MKKQFFNLSNVQLGAGLLLLIVATIIGVMAPEAGLTIVSALAIVPIWGVVKDNTFKEMTPEDVSKLETDDQIEYFNELNVYKAEQVNQLKIQMKADASKELAEKIQDLREEIMNDNKEQMKSLQKALEIQGLALNKLMTSRNKPSIKTIEDHLYAVKDDILNAKEKTVTIKTDVTTSSLTSSAFAFDIPGVGQIATLKTKIMQLFSQGSIGDGQGGVVRYVDQLAVTRNADWEDETDVKAESAITWITKTVALEIVADTIPVTNQALSNIPFIASEINNFLLTNLALKIDQDLFDGSGAAPIIEGIYTFADEYVAVASGITDANIYDLLKVIKTNITAATSYDPKVVLINATDEDLMTLKKDSHNNYLVPAFVKFVGDKMFVHGMEIVQTNVVTADTLLVGDFTKGVVYTHGGVKIDIGMIDKQFVENMVTLRVEQELALVVRSVHENAFNKETGIAAALVTLAS